MIDIHKIKGYLGYGVKVSLKYKDSDEIHTALLDTEIAEICKCYNLGMDYLIDFEVEYYKLHLCSIEDLTDEEMAKILTIQHIPNLTQRELKAYIYQMAISPELIEYLQSIHIDYQDLIGQGLAIKKVAE